MELQRIMQEFKQIEKDCNKKMKAGQAEHGEYDPETDQRDWYDEQIDELIDMINYAKMMILKLKYLQNEQRKMENN